MGARSWPWLRKRIIGLLAADTRVLRALQPPAASSGVYL